MSRKLAAIGVATVCAVVVTLVMIPFGGAARPVGTATMFANVNVDGTLASASGGVVASDQLGADGTYEVIFDRDVSRCAYASTAVADDNVIMGVAPRDTNLNGVYVVEYDNGLFEPRSNYSVGFDLIVVC